MIDENGAPSPETRALFRLLKPDLDQGASLKTLSEIAQETFLRPAGSERLSKEALAFFQKHYGALPGETQKAILENFKKIGDLGARYPFFQTPDYILIHGSSVSDMRTRILFFASLVREGKVTLPTHAKLFFCWGT
ncbi:MAG: hypothetical protein ACRCYZ_01145 [Alphaproteobacteria bacterium]